MTTTFPTDERLILNECDANTGWTGSVAVVAANAPLAAEATNQLGMGVSTSTDDAFVAITSDDYSGGGTLSVWMQANGDMDTLVNGGIMVQVTDGTNHIGYHTGGSDKAAFRHDDGPVKWECHVLDLANKPANNTVLSGGGSEASLDETAIIEVGVGFKTLSKALGGGRNCYWDIMRFADNGESVVMVGGTTLGAAGNGEEAAVVDRAGGNQQAYGVIRQLAVGVYGIQGNLKIGDAASASDQFWDETNVTYAWEDRGLSTNNYYRFLIEGSSTATNCEAYFTACTFSVPAAASASFDGNGADLTECDIIDTVFIGFDQGVETSGIATAVWTGNSYLGCEQVVYNGANMNGSTLSGSVVAADIGALLYNAAADPDGELDDLTITMGAASHHAIDFGTNVDSSLVSITLRGIDFAGFGSTDDANDSTLRFLATTGALTLNLIDCTVDGVSPVASGGGQNFSVHDTAGMTVTVVVAPVTLQITVSDAETLLPIQNVQTSIFLADSPFTELMNEDTTASGIASESYAGATPVDIKWRTRKSDELDDPRYFARSGLGEITSDGFTLSVLMETNTFLTPEPPPPISIIQSGHNDAGADSGSITVSPTLVAGVSRKLLVWGGYDDSDDTTITATYDGNAMTSINVVRLSLQNLEQELFRYDIPDVDSGSKDIVVTYGANRVNRSVMFVVIESAATGAEEDDDTDLETISETTMESIMTSTSEDTIFVHAALIGINAINIVAGNGATEELEEFFTITQGHIVYQIRTSSGANTISTDWTNNDTGVSNGCVIAQA